MQKQNYDVVILGAGAAGLMCALRAGQCGRRVLVLDRAAHAGAKILISGGGRCNFTNRTIAADRYISQNPHFCLSALKSYTQHDFVALVEKHGIAYHEKTLGQLFCDGSARDIVAMLLAECAAVQVDLRMNQTITDVTKLDVFQVQTEDAMIEAPALVLATGGLSIPKMGATGFSHQLAARFGLAMTETRPGLVPLIFDGEALYFMRALSGVSLEVVATCGKASFRENMIFTHRGLSGPAILQISSYCREGQALALNFLPDVDAEAFLLARKQERPKAQLKTILSELLPQRLAQSLSAALPTMSIGEFSHKSLRDTASMLKAWTVFPAGTEGYAKAEVTVGGISTQHIASKTMEANKVPGLYAVGEALDVTGWLGGYNLQWAWSSGWAAGSAIGRAGKA